MSRIDVGLNIIKHQHSFKSMHWSNKIIFKSFEETKNGWKWTKICKQASPYNVEKWNDLNLKKMFYCSLAKLDYKRVLWWCCVYGNWNAFINSFAIYEKNFKLLNGWFIKSKARCEITCHYFHGELGDANAQLASTIISKSLDHIIKRLWDIFNFDEKTLW
jgi:hypothetical protein